MGDKNRIGSLITKQRERVKMSKAELTRQLGLRSNSHIGAIEKGYWTPTRPATPTPELLEKIIAVLAAPPRLAEKMRDANLEARANPEGLELAERRGRRGTQDDSGASTIPEGTIPIVWIPVIDESFTGDPREVVMGTEGPEVVDHVPIPAALLEEHESCLGLLVSGDDMAPKIGHGAVVVASMTQKAVHGKLAVVGWEEGTICRMWRKRGDRITLTPMNPEFPAMEMDKSTIRWAQLAIWLGTRL